MITYFDLGTGALPTVGWDGADWYSLHQDNLFYRVFKNGALYLSANVTPGTLSFPKLDGTRAVLRDGTVGYVWPDVRQAFDPTKVALVDPCTGNDPIIQGSGYYAWITGGFAYQIQRQPIAGGAIVNLGTGAPTGLSRILSNGAVVLVDTDRNFRINGQVVGTRPAFSGGAVACEDIGSGIRVIYGTGPHLHLWPGEIAFTPQIALGATALLVATYGGGSGEPRVALITLDEFTGPFPSTPPGTPGGPFGPNPNLPATGATPQQKNADAAKLAAARRPRPVFPRVDEVKDEAAQTGLRILFDRVFEVEQQIIGTGGVNSQIAGLQSQRDSDQASLTTQLAQMSVAGQGTSIALGGAFPTPTPPGGQNPPPQGGGIANQIDVVIAARATYDALGPGVERAGRITNQVAWDLRNQGVGVVRKTSGTNWMGWSIDVIMVSPGGATYDILRDAEGDAEPQWSRTSPTGFGDIDDWQAPVDPSSI